MKRAVFIIVISVMAVVLLWSGGGMGLGSTPAVMLQMMDATDITAMEGKATYWGLIREEFLEMAELTSLAEKIVADIGLEEEGVWQKAAEETFHLVDVAGNLPGGLEGRVILQSVPPVPDRGPAPAGRQGATFVLIKLVEKGGRGKVLQAGERMENILKPYEIEGRLTLELMGYLPENCLQETEMSEVEMKNFVRKLLHDFQGEVVESMEGAALVSLTGHTPLIERYLQSGEKKININIALRYDSYRGRTVLRVGVPIISGGY